MAEAKKPLRVGLMLDGWTIPAWAHRMISMIVASDYAEVALVLMNGKPPEKSGTDWSCALFRLYLRLERVACAPKPNAFAPQDAQDLLAEVETLTVTPIDLEGCDNLSGNDLENVRTRNLDVLIQLGFRHPATELRGTARYGVWALRHLDPERMRGTYAGFREVFEHHPITGSALQMLDEETFNGPILARSWSATTRYSVLGNRNRVCWKSLSLIPRALREMHRLGAEQFFESVGADMARPLFYDRPWHEEPTNGEFLRLFIGHVCRSIRLALRDALYREDWFLLYNMADGLSTVFHRYEGHHMPPRGRLYADPHVVEEDGAYHVFYESTPCGKASGRIECITIDRNGRCGMPQTVLERDYHLAYPSIIHWNDTYYMIPDSGANQTVDIYRCERFPDQWAFHKSLMTDIRAVDPTLFEHGGRWWMFLGVIEHEGGSFSDELFLYHADNPLSDRWTPHPMNPIVSDARKARPAGAVLHHEGHLYRLSQNCSHGYGYGINLHEITSLTETAYTERDVQSLEPHWDRHIAGLHTLAHAGDLTMIDAKTRRFRFLP